MADLAAGDVAYTIISRSVDNFSRKLVTATLVFGDGAKTYPSGGIPITPSSLGLPNNIDNLNIFDFGAAGYVCSYDQVNQKLRLFQRDQHTHNLLLKNTAVADGATTRVNAGANLLGANTGSDITVTGGGANGGVVNAAPAVLTELVGASSVVSNAVTLKIEATGY